MYDPKLHDGKESYVQPSNNALNSGLIFIFIFFFACSNVTSDGGLYIFCLGVSG